MRKFLIPGLTLLLLAVLLVGCNGGNTPGETTVDPATTVGDVTESPADPDSETTDDSSEDTTEEVTTEDYFEVNRVETVAPDPTKFPDVSVTGEGYDIYQLAEGSTWGYRYGATYLYNDDGSVDAYFACVGVNGEWDWISYRHSPDNGQTWGDEKIVLTPTQGSMDFYSNCDPGVVYFNGYYYLAYTSTISNLMTCNNVFVARSKNPDGPFEKWNGSGWGGYEPQPIFYYDENYTVFGMGEPSFVELNGTLYIYYTNNAPSGGYTMVATADATDENWPATIQNHGVAVKKDTDSLDIKYVEEWGKFIGLGTGDRMSPGSWLGFFESNDGIHFELVEVVREGTLPYLHNAGLSSRRNGHIRLTEDADKLRVVYAYGRDPGQWNTRVQPISMTLSDGNDMSAERNKASLPYELERAELVAAEDRYVSMIRPNQDVYTYALSRGSFTLRLYQYDTYFEQTTMRKETEGISFMVYDESVCTIDPDSWKVTLHNPGTTAVEVWYKDLVFLFHVCVTEKRETGNVSTTVELKPVRDAYTIYIGERGLYHPQIRTRLYWANGTFTEYFVTDTDTTMSFTGYDDKIIKVDSRGTLTAMAVGETNVTVTCQGKSCTVKVIISEDPEDGFFKMKDYKEPDYINVDLSQPGNEKVFGGVGNTRLEYDAVEQALKATVTNHDCILDMYVDNALTVYRAEDYKTLEITYMIPMETSEKANTMQVFLSTGEVTGAAEACSVLIPLVRDGEYHTISIDLTALAYWTGDIHGIRIDYFHQATVGDVMYLKRVQLIEK